MIWSVARNEKFQVIISTTGLMPIIAMPTAAPVNPSSEMGVSMTLLGPYWSMSPSVMRWVPP
jgi:hypothetical protein